MKHLLIPLIVVLFIAWTAHNYDVASAQKVVGLDRVCHDLGGLSLVLPRDANITLAPVMASGADSSDLLAGLMFVRMALAPRHLTLTPGCDTVLTLFDRKPADAEIAHAVEGRQVLWTNNADDCLYILTCTKPPNT